VDVDVDALFVVGGAGIAVRDGARVGPRIKRLVGEQRVGELGDGWAGER
jgi:hypothetical protein